MKPEWLPLEFFFLKNMLRLRYRIFTRGLQKIKPLKRKGILFLPTHPAEIDPLILMSVTWPIFKTRPAVIEDTCDLPALRGLFTSLKAISVPNFSDAANWEKKAQIYWQNVHQVILDGLAQKENFIFYPSGCLKRQEKESVLGVFGAYELIRQLPDAHVVIVRIKGLWGSRFSCYYERDSPHFFRTLKQSFHDLLQNLIILAPRRRVVVEFEEVSKEELMCDNRIEFNQKLEKYYNTAPLDKEYVLPYTFWGKYLKRKPLENSCKELSSLKEETLTKIFTEVSRLAQVPTSKIHLQSKLREDLGLDSLQLCELVHRCEKVLPYGKYNTFYLQTLYDLFTESSKNQEKKE